MKINRDIYNLFLWWALYSFPVLTRYKKWLICADHEYWDKSRFIDVTANYSCNYS